MSGPPERGAFDRRGLRVHRIDLNHPAKAVELVGMFGGIEPFVMGGPAEEGVLDHAPASLMGVGLGATSEVEAEIFFAAQVGPPGRHATGAIVQRAQHGAAVRVGSGAHQGMAGSWPGQGKWRTGGQPACIARRAHHLPLPSAVLLHLNHTDAVGRLALEHLLGGPGFHAIGMQQTIVDVFVVHHKQAATASVQR